jgi:2-oxoglutarate dehydrogenase E2 component (dihydrolipoamide succinyltransferase)
MPQLGETVVEGTITKWLKKEGEAVAQDEPLFEISTDKVDTEVPSPVAGTLVQIKVQEGQTVSVGTELATIDAGEGAAEASTADSAPAESAPADAAPVAASDAPAQAAPPAPAAPAPAAPAPPATTAPAPAAPAAPAVAAGAERSSILSPLVRRLADEHNIDLAQVTGTGTGGRITKADVMALVEGGGAAPPAPAPAQQEAPAAPAEAPGAAIEAPGAAIEAPAAQAPVAQAPVAAAAPAAPAVAAPAAPTENEEVVPMTRMRQVIAEHMVTSVQTSARAWTLVEVNMENVVRLREKAKDGFAQREGAPLTYMPFIASAVDDALIAFPYVNAELRGDQLILRKHVNLGIAVALEDGLIVPVVPGADSMNIAGLARAINDVATRARNRQLKPDEVHGSTFTITNPGPFGSIMSVPIINQPNSAILAFDTIEKRPVVVGDAIAIRHMVYLSMSWDHRVIDGSTAAQFLARVKENLETRDFGPDLGLPAGS